MQKKINKLKNMIARWGTKILFTLGDQGITSVTNFVLNMLLIRWLSAEDYGRFALLFSLGLLGTMVSGTLVSEPMLVYGNTKYKDKQKECYKKNSILIVLISLIAAIGIGAFLKSIQSVIVLYLFIVSFSLFMEARRMAITIMKPELAMRANIFYPLFVIVALFGFKEFMTPELGMVTISISTLLCSLIGWAILKDKLTSSGEEVSMSEVFKENWKYGSWRLGGGVSGWINNAYFIPLIYATLGPVQAGVYKAMDNLFAPIVRLLNSINNLILPWLSVHHEKEGDGYTKKAVGKTSLLYFLIAIGLILIIVLFKKELIMVLYKKEYLLDYLWIIKWFGLIILLKTITLSLGVVLNSKGKTKETFIASAISALIVLIGTNILNPQIGLLGIIFLLAVSSLASLSLSYYFIRMK